MGNKAKMTLLLPLLLPSLPFLSSCGPKIEEGGITILYSTDVHCAIDENLGYSRFAAFKEDRSKTNFVLTVDAGDFLQGNFLGAVSDGAYAIEAMNAVGYDVVTLGNHEFDYGMDVLTQRLNELEGEVVSCNISYIGKKENPLSMVKPYTIKECGDKKIGFVGVTTPSSLTSSTPSSFKEDGETVFDFHAEDPSSFYSLVQDNIDSCKENGADYVFLLTHLGPHSSFSPFSSLDLISHTSGAFAVLDGHAHMDYRWNELPNKDGEKTYLVGAGTNLREFAAITLNPSGSTVTEFITSYNKRSKKVEERIESINSAADELGNEVVAKIDCDLPITDFFGARTVRNRETPLANLITDAFKKEAESEIAFINGGAIRNSLSKGEITYRDVRDVLLFGDYLSKKRVSGQTILDYLEFSSRKVESSASILGYAQGESGGFSHPSGLRYCIDSSIPSPVKVKGDKEFVGIEGERRVYGVEVLQGESYVPLDPNKEYTVASTNFVLDDGGDGASMLISSPNIPVPAKFDYEVLLDYIVELNGKLASRYSQTEGRVIVS